MFVDVKGEKRRGKENEEGDVMIKDAMAEDRLMVHCKDARQTQEAGQRGMFRSVSGRRRSLDPH